MYEAWERVCLYDKVRTRVSRYLKEPSEDKFISCVVFGGRYDLLFYAGL